MVTFIAFEAPFAPGTETTAFASPLLAPTTTFSITASVPHFSVSLFTLSFSTAGAPAYVGAAVPGLERDRREHCGRERRARRVPGAQRALDHEAILAVGVDRFARRLGARERGDLRGAVRRRLAHALAVLPAQEVDGVRTVAHQEVRPLGTRRDLGGELERDRIGVELARRIGGGLGRVVPGQVEGDLLVVVDGAHGHEIDRRIEVPRVHDHLPHQRDVARRQLLPVVGVRVVRDRVGDRRDRDERRVAWGLRPARNNDVRQVPDIVGLLDAVERGGHRGAEAAVGEAGGDLGPARASAEGPPLGEVRGRDRVAPLVLQLGARRAVGPPVGAVALVTLDRLEHLLAALDRLRGRGDVLRQLEVLRTLLELLRRERLDVRDEIPPVLFGEYRPRGHRRSGHAVRDDPEDILVRRDLVRRCPDLVEARGEVAGLRGKQLGGRSLAIPLVIVAARAFPFVYGLSRARVPRLRGDERRHGDEGKHNERSNSEEPRTRIDPLKPLAASVTGWGGAVG